MNLKTVRIFLEVVRAGSLSAAARNLHMSQPAVTKQLQNLEKELGFDLLIRGYRGITGLTPAGQLFREHAERALAEFEQFLRRVRTSFPQNRGELSLAASTTPGHFILPALLLAFRNRYPDIQTHLNIANTATVIERVLAGKSDLGFIGRQAHDPELVVMPFLEDRVVLVVPADHPFAGRREVALSELFNQKLILRESGSATRESVQRQLAPEDWKALERAAILELGSTHAVLAAIADGAGIGFVSLRAVEERGGSDVAVVPVQGVDCRRQLFIVYLRERKDLALLQAFVNFAREWSAGARS